MSFANPLGLLVLIGIPIIVLIYIWRNKYNEQTVPSTYLWELSERFFKRRNPLSAIAGIISLVLQILLVILLSMSIARPSFILPDSAAEYCFVIDASGSMNMKSGGKTRFERAKTEIRDIIDDARLGSTYTLISASDSASVVYEKQTDKQIALDMIDELECSYGTTSYSDAIKTAQKYFDENPSVIVYLITDKDVKESKNIEIVNVGSQNNENYSINNVSGIHTGGELKVSATVKSYTSDASIKVELYVNGSKKAVDSKVVEAAAGEETETSLSFKTESYESYRVVIDNNDSLPEDNEYVSYNHKNETSYSVLIVSEKPFFIQAALDALTDAKIDTVKPEGYKGEGEYGLYVFDSYTPDVLPDAAVWLINSAKSVDNSGFGARGVVELSEPRDIVKTDSTASTAVKLLDGILGKEIAISEYIKYSGMYTKFNTLFTCDANPVIFAGVNGLGNREVVIGFDLHKSDFALSSDFVPLLGNLLDYSCPDIIDAASYECGDEAQVNVTSQIKNVKVTAPDGSEIYIDTSSDASGFKLDTIGTYTIDLTVAGVDKEYNVYCYAPREESVPLTELESFALAGEREYERADGRFDPIAIVLICLALVFSADWMVYCYEKYQLR